MVGSDEQLFIISKTASTRSSIKLVLIKRTTSKSFKVNQGLLEAMIFLIIYLVWCCKISVLFFFGPTLSMEVKTSLMNLQMSQFPRERKAIKSQTFY